MCPRALACLRHAQLVAAIEAARATSMSQTERSGMAAWIRGAEAALAGRRGGRGMQVQRRKLHEAMVAGGMRQDGRGRHAVAQVVQWRGGHRDREALVQWEGFDTSEEGGGAAWEDQWLPRACLTADLREGGRLRPYARRKRKADVAADVVAAAGGSAQGARRSARLSDGAFSVVMYDSGERAIVRRALPMRGRAADAGGSEAGTSDGHVQAGDAGDMEEEGE